MKKLALIVFFSLFLGGCTLRNPFLKKPAGLEVSSDPTAVVYLNDNQLGTTPLTRDDLEPGDYTLKLVPQEDGLTTWETQLTLKKEATTIISRNFADSETDSAGYILELRQDAGDQAYLSIVSDPDTINLHLDGQAKGYTPVSRLEVSPGSHQLLLSSPGYHELPLSLNAVKGYNLVISAKLSPDLITLSTPPPSTSSATTPEEDSSPPQDEQLPDSTQLDPPYVTIKETGTGWLRVRKEPSATSVELGKVNVGEELPYLEDTTETGWYKVEFEGEEGWLSARYATLVKQ